MLHELIIVLEVAVLEEDQVVVFVTFNAVLAESVCALIAGPFDFLSLMAQLLAIRNGSFAGRLDGLGLGTHTWVGCLLACARGWSRRFLAFVLLLLHLSQKKQSISLFAKN